MRGSRWVWVSACVVALGCGVGCGGKTDPAPSDPIVADPQAVDAATARTPTLADVTALVERLADPDQRARDAAAAELRAALGHESLAAEVERTASFWQERIDGLENGISVDDVEEALSAHREGGASSGGSTTMMFRLDDYWMFSAYFDSRVDPEQLFEVGPLQRSVRNVWVAPPDGYTGPWVTYFVNGRMSHEIDYAGGSYAQFRAYYDNGQLIYEQRYVDGTIDGPQHGFNEDGSTSYTGGFEAGVRVGTWVHWHDNGVKASEETYINGELDGVATTWREDGTKWLERYYRNGQEVGQASWDENGALQYANGEAKSRYP